MTKIKTEKMKMAKKETRATVTRPKLARILADSGYEVRAITSIWDSSKVEWEFDLTDRSARIVADYYAEIGRRPPLLVREYMEAGK